MIADRRSEELCKGSKNERSPFGLALPRVSGAAPTTTPERLSESHGLRCLIAANISGRDQSMLAAGRCAGPPPRQSNPQKQRSQNSLRASSPRAAPDPESVKPNPANMYRRCASR